MCKYSSCNAIYQTNSNLDLTKPNYFFYFNNLVKLTSVDFNRLVKVCWVVFGWQQDWVDL